MEDYGFWAVIIARVSPVLSNDATSFVAGLLRMGYWKFIAATLAGIIPLTGAIAYLGGNFQRLKSGLIWISAVSLVLLIIYIIYDRKKKKHR
ncbi:TVP38/TMEM64 family protein [Zunongwangia sp. H14]|uniref:TVP38/TMEM64 family protein n=1 Tax=Zunongwangia sp. H14 TaxID=3240792 RepID=UPI003564C312